MTTIEEYLKECDTAEKRSVLYYLGRYLKQGKIFKSYQKDIFEDDHKSSPDDRIKSLTLDIVSFIESNVGKKVPEFDENDFFYWMDLIAEIENEIDELPSDLTIDRAQKELEKFETPKSKIP